MNKPTTKKPKLTRRQQIIRYAVSLPLGIAGGLGILLIFLWLPARVTYQIRESYAFSLPAGQSGPVALGVLLPKSGPYQKVSDPQISGGDTQTWQDYPEVRLLQLSGDLPAGETSISITYEVTIQQGRVRWEAPVEAWELQPQPGIESSAPEIAAIVNQTGAGLDRAAAYRQYLYVSKALVWPDGSRTGGTDSALAALHSGEGVCAHFANLMVAVNRAAGIPARSISGLLFPYTLLPWVPQTTTWNSPAGAHAWVEFHTADGWEMADPSWAAAFPFLYFGRNDGGHLSYGEKEAEALAYQQLSDWATAQGEMMAAMSAPLKFVAASPVNDASLNPSVTVRKGWDGRWLNALLFLLILGVVGRVVDGLVLKIFAGHS